jgi:hydroxypyruvate isomerase
MPRISICIEMLFGELDFYRRPAAVAEAGFEAIEFWGTRDKDLDALGAACLDAGVQVATFGGLGGQALVRPQPADALEQAMASEATTARLLGTETLIVTVGNEVKELSRQEQFENIVANLKAVAPVAAEAGVRLAVEPLNTLVDHAGYFLDSSEEGLHIVEEVASPAVGLLYDVYHMQIMEGDLIRTIRKAFDSIYHVHVADVPGRHEPGTGEINYANVLRALDEAGYDGWCGMEFRPTGASTDALRDTMRACGLA